MSRGKLVLVRSGNQEQEFALSGGSVTIGRAEVNDIVLVGTKVSRTHARLDCGEAGCVLMDLGSANGTRVNGRHIERALLAHGDMLSLGDETLRFETTAPRSEPETTLISSEEELEQTLTQETLPTNLANTREPRLVVCTPGKTWEVTITGDELTIGRKATSDIALKDPKVSRQHARIERRGQTLVIRDLGGANGTRVGNRRITEHALSEGDSVRIGRARLVFKSAFTPDDLTVDGLSGKESLARRPVVFVPGIMGSELWRGSERLWPNLRYLFTRPDAFRLSDDNPVEARSVLGEVVIIPNLVRLAQYNRLGNYLEEGLGYERGKDLLEVPYDWRQDNRVSAQHLAKVIEGWQSRYAEAARPLTIIAHSMGCLVSRYYIERLGGKGKVERLIFLGGPHQGTRKAITTLLTGPQILPFGLLGDRLRDWAATLPSIYQIVPNYMCAVDQEGHRINVMTDETWLPESQRPLLRDARNFRRELGGRSSVPCVCIFGYGLKTVTALRVLRNAQRVWQKVDFGFEPGGDTSVPEASAILEGSEIHPVEQYHGSLYTDNDVKMRLKVELTKGFRDRPAARR